MQWTAQGYRGAPDAQAQGSLSSGHDPKLHRPASPEDEKVFLSRCFTSLVAVLPGELQVVFRSLVAEHHPIEGIVGRGGPLPRLQPKHLLFAPLVAPADC